MERDLTGHGHVVIAGEAHRGVLAGELHASIGLGAVADEIAEAPELGGVARSDRLKGRLEGVPICVDVRDDCDLHRCRVGTTPISPRLARVIPLQVLWPAPRRPGAARAPYSASGSEPVSVPPYSGRFLMPSRVRHLE